VKFGLGSHHKHTCALREQLQRRRRFDFEVLNESNETSLYLSLVVVVQVPGSEPN